jgi:WD40 repeat protein
MVMAISIFSHPLTTHLTVIAGYESGHAVVSHLLPSSQWEVVYTSQAHTQPILSLDVSPGKEFFITSSADGIIAKHPVAGGKGNDIPMKTQQTGHSGQQGLRMRDDGKIFATAGWDARVRVYESRSLRELAVLKWHKEGCYAVSFADVEGGGGEEEGEGSKAVVRRTGTLTVREERVRRARMVHWLAVGGKDGKVSLWDIY